MPEPNSNHKPSAGRGAAGKGAGAAYRFQAVPPPAVLQVIPAMETGGAERTTFDIAAALIQAGGRAFVATSGGRMAAELKEMGAVVLPLPAASKNPVLMVRNARRLARFVKANGIDLIHARSRAPAWSALWAARAARVPFVTTYHGTYNARGVLKRFYNSVMARGDLVIANSDFIAQHIAAMHGTALSRIVTIPRGVDLAHFDPEAVAPARVAALRKMWGVPEPDGPLILLPGRLTRWKGQAVFVEALAALRGRGLDFIGVCVGDAQGRGAYAAEIKTLIRERGLMNRVLLPGHCADMPGAYAAADVAVSASLDPEAFGRAAVEAQAMARPVIATDHGAARETVLTAEDAGEAHATGWRVTPGHAGALAQALERAITLKPPARAAMGKRGRAHVAAHYSLAAMCARTLAVYERLLGGGTVLEGTVREGESG